MLIQIQGAKLDSLQKLLEAQVLMNPIVNALVNKFTPVEEAKIIRKEDGAMYVYHIGKQTQTDAEVLAIRGIRFPKAKIDPLEKEIELPEIVTETHALILTNHVKLETAGVPLTISETDKVYIATASNPGGELRRYLIQNHVNATLVDNPEIISKRLTVKAVDVKTVLTTPVVVALDTPAKVKEALITLIDPEGEHLFAEDIELSSNDLRDGYGYTATLLNSSLVYYGKVDFLIGAPGEPEEPSEGVVLGSDFLQYSKIDELHIDTNIATLGLPRLLPAGYTVALFGDGYKPSLDEQPKVYQTLAEFDQAREGLNQYKIVKGDFETYGSYYFKINEMIDHFIEIATEKFNIYTSIHLFNEAGELVSQRVVDAGYLFNKVGNARWVSPSVQTVGLEKRIIVDIKDLELPTGVTVTEAVYNLAYSSMNATITPTQIWADVGKQIDVEFPFIKIVIGLSNGKRIYIYFDDINRLDKGTLEIIYPTTVEPVTLATHKVQWYKVNDYTIIFTGDALLALDPDEHVTSMVYTSRNGVEGAFDSHMFNKDTAPTNNLYTARIPESAVEPVLIVKTNTRNINLALYDLPAELNAPVFKVSNTVTIESAGDTWSAVKLPEDSAYLYTSPTSSQVHVYRQPDYFAGLREYIEAKFSEDILVTDNPEDGYDTTNMSDKTIQIEIHLLTGEFVSSVVWLPVGA